MSNQTTFRGVVHGNTVVLVGETGLPDGQEVTVSLQPYLDPDLARQGLARSFGAWKDRS